MALGPPSDEEVFRYLKSLPPGEPEPPKEPLVDLDSILRYLDTIDVSDLTFGPHFHYNRTGQMIERYLTNDPSVYQYVDRHLSVAYSRDDPSVIIGYTIEDLYGLLTKCFSRELAEEVKKLIDEYCDAQKEEQQNNDSGQASI